MVGIDGLGFGDLDGYGADGTLESLGKEVGDRDGVDTVAGSDVYEDEGLVGVGVEEREGEGGDLAGPLYE